MRAEEEISRSQFEQDAAIEDLRNTLHAVNAKVERVESEIRPDHLVERHAAGAAIAGGALGFLIGSAVKNRAAGFLLIAAVAGLAWSIRASRKSGLESE